MGTGTSLGWKVGESLLHSVPANSFLPSGYVTENPSQGKISPVSQVEFISISIFGVFVTILHDIRLNVSILLSSNPLQEYFPSA